MCCNLSENGYSLIQSRSMFGIIFFQNLLINPSKFIFFRTTPSVFSWFLIEHFTIIEIVKPVFPIIGYSSLPNDLRNRSKSRFSHCIFNTNFEKKLCSRFTTKIYYSLFLSLFQTQKILIFVSVASFTSDMQFC